MAPKEPLYLSEIEQLDLMLEYTKVHSKYNDDEKLRREIECLKVLFPKVFRPMYDDDLILGRFDALLVGFGSVTSVGGPGHYGRIEKFDDFSRKIGPKYEKEITFLKEYWKNNDTREIFYKENLIENVLGRFVDVLYPAIITARFSGMYLNYNLLLDNGIDGLKEIIKNQMSKKSDSKEEYQVMIEALDLLQVVIEHHILEVKNKLKESLSDKRKMEMQKLLNALITIKHEKPNSFISAMQLAWLYSCLAGVVNFGRMDDYLGDYLVNDLNKGIITEEEAILYIQSLWRLIEVKEQMLMEE